MKTFVLLGNSPRVALPVLQAVRSLGGGRCVVAGGKQTLGLRWSRLCRRHVLIDLRDDDGAVRAINRLAEQEPRATLIPYDCDAVRLFNRVRSQVMLESVPVPDSATLEMFDDKWLFYRFCLANGLPAPMTRYLGSKGNLEFGALEAEFGLPFVVKPTNCSGSEGVQIVRSRKDLEDRILHDPGYGFGSLIAQRYIDGIDMDINLLSIHGRLCAFSIHRTTGSWIEFMPNAELEEMTWKVCHGSGYQGVMNVDVRLERGTGKLFVIESNPRFWATLAAPVACGLNFLAESIQPCEPEVGPRCLTSGRFQTRHPLLTPGVWRQLHADRGATGRLLRARLFDVYSLGQLVQEVPAMARRFAARARRSPAGKTPQAA